ncbi:MAG: hypothetical protein KDC38_14410, partial [Planctomycetes bacterium]|nr:hypothetical protein [Planctomycetota bacterium]
VPWLIGRIPAHYFATLHAPPPPPNSWRAHHPVVRMVIHGVRNGLGAILVLMGIAMLVLPGQGVIAILLGLGLMAFPGKRRLELGIIRQKPVLRAIQWLRRKGGHEPLVVAERTTHQDSDSTE